jgi:hypothetical protein
MVQNVVLNNSSHSFSAHSDAIRAQQDQTLVVATPGTDAAVNNNLRAQLESGALTSAGKGVNAEYSA